MDFGSGCKSDHEAQAIAQDIAPTRHSCCQDQICGLYVQGITVSQGLRTTVKLQNMYWKRCWLLFHKQTSLHAFHVQDAQEGTVNLQVAVPSYNTW